MDNADIITLVALVFSVLSFLLSMMVYNNTNEQFKVLNQSYLQVQPNFTWRVTGDETVVPKDSEKRIIGINPFTVCTNSGNLPLKFKLKKCTIEFEGRTVDPFADEQTTEIILYPKDAITIYMKGIIFNPNGAHESFDSLRQKRVNQSIVIEYQDLAINKVKIIEREIFHLLNGFTSSISAYSLISDKN